MKSDNCLSGIDSQLSVSVYTGDVNSGFYPDAHSAQRKAHQDWKTRELPRMSHLLQLLVLIMFGCEYHSNCKDLRSSDPSIREAAVERLIGTAEAKRSITDLIKCLRDSNPTIREKAIMALSQIGSPAVDELLVACKHKDARIRAGAILALGRSSGKWPKFRRKFSVMDDQHIYPILVEALRDKNYEVRASAAESFYPVSLGAGKDMDAQKHLINALKENHEAVRYSAVDSIAWLARESNDPRQFGPSVRPLIGLLTDKEVKVRGASAWALSEIGSNAKHVIPALIKGLTDKDETVQNAFHNSLIKLSSANKKIAIPLLVKGFRDANEEDRRYKLLFAIRLIKPIPKSILPILVTALQDESLQVRHLAVIMLGEMQGNAHDAVPALQNALTKNPQSINVTIAWALYQIDSHPERVISILLHALQHKEASVREEAVETLGEIGPSAKQAIPGLLRLRNDDPNEKVRNSAQIALNRIRKR